MSQGENPTPEAAQPKKRPVVVWVAVIIVVLIVIIAGSYYAYSLTKKSTTPGEIVIGTLYASTGGFASTSMPEYDGLQLWATQVNNQGGIFVSSLNEKMKVKIVAYDDSSDPGTATTLYNQLITVNKVNFLVADFGSVLTAPAVSIAEEHHVLLFDVTGSSASFFNVSSPYIVLTSIPGSPAYATYGAPQLMSLNITKVAVAYAENDFTTPLSQIFVSDLEAHNITPVYDQGFSTSQSDFTSMITTLQSYKPQAVVFYGYPTNDIPFINEMHSMGVTFPYLFTIFPGQLYTLMQSAVGNNMTYTFTYAFPPETVYNNVNYGMSLSALESAWNSTYSSVPFGYLSVAGYTAGLIIQDGIATAGSLNATLVRNAINSFSGKITTVDGLFQVDSVTGMQTGEAPPIGQVVPNGSGGLKVNIVYPSSMATGTPVYPAP
ncbi:MAG: ABC transporter substrate-binding protein [Candidatus Thermoplasmatota archaeon]|jgi:branched-chain amino acid transport system substrate-binding protein|nr:ABC transporter substrate-binding protein [Candidatus Thermoplasmatota archaeon]MCL5680494.1 ABC transporter substrate-binding protein [Candidatus Thermoplasmatota archaeon]